MSDFETNPVGTAKRLAEAEARLAGRWLPFGSYVDVVTPDGLEFDGEGEDGLPIWERPVARITTPADAPKPGYLSYSVGHRDTLSEMVAAVPDYLPKMVRQLLEDSQDDPDMQDRVILQMTLEPKPWSEEDI